jgi:hypothetical protein
MRTCKLKFLSQKTILNKLPTVRIVKSLSSVNAAVNLTNKLSSNNKLSYQDRILLRAQNT